MKVALLAEDVMPVAVARCEACALLDIQGESDIKIEKVEMRAALKDLFIVTTLISSLISYLLLC